MVKILERQSPPPLPKHTPTILYLGQNADEICDLVSPHIGAMDIEYEAEIAKAISAARRKKRDVIIVDQRDGALASKLVLPLFQDLGYPVKIVVISVLSSVGDYLRIPGVARVITAPVRETQLIRVLGLDPTRRRHDKIKLAQEANKETPEQAMPAASPVPRATKKPWAARISDFGMKIVSTAYKRMAFVLLGSLFVAFTFYGFLIGFYLISTSWGQPQTLSEGVAVVDKVKRDIADLQVALNLNSQRISDAKQKAQAAAVSLKDAQILVKFTGDTIDKEIVNRRTQMAVVNRNMRRTMQTSDGFARQLGKAGMSADLQKLFAKRLIERRTFESGTMGLLETGQRLSGMQNDLDKLAAEEAQLEQSLAMLRSLRVQLTQKEPMTIVNSTSSDLLLLIKQSVDARGTFDTAKNDLAAAKKNTVDLANSKHVLETQISGLETSTLGKAILKPVPVAFVPYANEAHFEKGAPIYACRFTMLFCWKGGTIGERVPGEVQSIHPFFGKPIRGFYVELNLTEPKAATKEIIHANRPPLFFF